MSVASKKLPTHPESIVAPVICGTVARLKCQTQSERCLCPALCGLDKVSVEKGLTQSIVKCEVGGAVHVRTFLSAMKVEDEKSDEGA